MGSLSTSTQSLKCSGAHGHMHTACRNCLVHIVFLNYVHSVHVVFQEQSGFYITDKIWRSLGLKLDWAINRARFNIIAGPDRWFVRLGHRKLRPINPWHSLPSLNVSKQHIIQKQVFNHTIAFLLTVNHFYIKKTIWGQKPFVYPCDECFVFCAYKLSKFSTVHVVFTSYRQCAGRLF